MQIGFHIEHVTPRIAGMKDLLWENAYQCAKYFKVRDWTEKVKFEFDVSIGEVDPTTGKLVDFYISRWKMDV